LRSARGSYTREIRGWECVEYDLGEREASTRRALDPMSEIPIPFKQLLEPLIFRLRR
jgi:hypothetical protein